MSQSRTSVSHLEVVLLAAVLVVTFEAPISAFATTTTSTTLPSTGTTTTTLTTTTGTTTTTTTTTTGTTTTTTATTTTQPSTTTTTEARVMNPFASPSVLSYLDSRTNSITAAVFNPTTGREYSYHPGILGDTASMVKIDILADLLYECQREHRAMTNAEQSAAVSMIEYSDNRAAQMLWNDIGGYGLSAVDDTYGGYGAIQQFNHLIGFTQTVTSWTWGLMRTDPHDFIQLLKVIVLPNDVLSLQSRTYEQNLMQHVVSYQRFGVPYGVPPNAVVGNKNGWYPEKDTGWQVNSAGYVRSGRTYYLAVVMTTRNSSESYAINVVNGFGLRLWNFESGSSR